MILSAPPPRSANLGAGFDCAGGRIRALERARGHGRRRRRGRGRGRGRRRAAARRAQPRGARLRAARRPGGKRFRFVNRIPLERGLGSSAAAIALGSSPRRRPRAPEELLAAGLDARAPRRQPRGRARSAASRSPGTGRSPGSRTRCRSRRSPSSRRADVRPSARAHAAGDRSSCRRRLRRAGRAALLGAGAASGDADLFAAALGDRLHEPYRPSDDARRAPRRPAAGLRAARRSPGSGPTVIVWADDAAACAAALRERFPDHDVLELAVCTAGRPVSDRCSSTCARGRRTTPGTSPAPSTSTPRATSPASRPDPARRRPAPAARDATARRGLRARRHRRRQTFVLALDDGTGWAARCWWLLRHLGHDAAGTLDLRAYVGPAVDGDRADHGPATSCRASARDDTIDGGGDPRAARRSRRSCSTTPAAAPAGAATRSRSTRSPAGSRVRATRTSPSRCRPARDRAARARRLLRLRGHRLRRRPAARPRRSRGRPPLSRLVQRVVPPRGLPHRERRPP